MHNELQNRHHRTRQLLGDEALAALNASHVAIIGLGGVGGFVLEALSRSGIGRLTLVDGDDAAPSNLNRQLLATESSLGTNKALLGAQRVQTIDSSIAVTAHGEFLTASNVAQLLSPLPDLIVDCIDQMTHKLSLIAFAYEKGIPLISAAGAGNRLSPLGFVGADVFDSQGDAVCRILRRELRARNIDHLRVVYAPTPPDKTLSPPASMIFAPGSMGLVLAYEAVQRLLEMKGNA